MARKAGKPRARHGWRNARMVPTLPAFSPAQLADLKRSGIDSNNQGLITRLRRVAEMYWAERARQEGRPTPAEVRRTIAALRGPAHRLQTRLLALDDESRERLLDATSAAPWQFTMNSEGAERALHHAWRHPLSTGRPTLEPDWLDTFARNVEAFAALTERALAVASRSGRPSRHADASLAFMVRDELRKSDIPCRKYRPASGTLGAWETAIRICAQIAGVTRQTHAAWERFVDNAWRSLPAQTHVEKP